MKFLLLILVAAPLWANADDPPGSATAAAEQALAAPLRRFDRDKDGKLDGIELKEARQAHNRGGREAEPNRGRIKEMMERLRNEFMERFRGDFDASKDGKLDDTEKKEADKVWSGLEKRYHEIRREVTAKHDKNDDGELGENERGASRKESENLRNAAAAEAVRKWKEAREAPASQAKS